MDGDLSGQSFHATGLLGGNLDRTMGCVSLRRLQLPNGPRAFSSREPTTTWIPCSQLRPRPRSLSASYLTIVQPLRSLQQLDNGLRRCLHAVFVGYDETDTLGDGALQRFGQQDQKQARDSTFSFSALGFPQMVTPDDIMLRVCDLVALCDRGPEAAAAGADELRIETLQAIAEGAPGAVALAEAALQTVEQHVGGNKWSRARTTARHPIAAALDSSVALTLGSARPDARQAGWTGTPPMRGRNVHGGGAYSSGAIAAPGEPAVTTRYRALPIALCVMTSVRSIAATIVPIPHRQAG